MKRHELTRQKARHHSRLLALILVVTLSGGCGGGGGENLLPNIVLPKTVTFIKYFGAKNNSLSLFIKQTSDGGYIFTGCQTEYSPSYDQDLWVVKTDVNGDVIWEKKFDYGNGCGKSIIETKNGNFVVAGDTSQIVNNTSSKREAWILKLDSSGSVIWEQMYERKNITIRDMKQTSDGGYILSGRMDNEEPTGLDLLIIKLDEVGVIEWEKTYGDSDYDSAYSVIQTSDEQYIVVGYKGLSSEYASKQGKAWILKLSNNGNLVWSITRSSTIGNFSATTVLEDSEGKYIVGGYIHPEENYQHNAWMARLDKEGLIEWENNYLEFHNVKILDIKNMSTGGFIAVGNSVSNVNGYDDNIYLLKLDYSGNLTWYEVYGSSILSESASSVWQTADGGYIICGNSRENEKEYFDAWILKLDDQGMCYGCF